MTNPLDEIFSTPDGRARHGCVVCGKPTEAAVSIEIRRLTPDGKGKFATGKHTSKSRTVAMCAEHAAAQYHRLRQHIQ